jgi:hypothetical protein
MTFHATKQQVFTEAFRRTRFSISLSTGAGLHLTKSSCVTTARTFIRMSSECSGLGRILDIAGPLCWR